MFPHDVSIVVVDDERDNLDLYQRVLAGCLVRAFEDPNAALKSVAEDPPTCMLVDYRMPEMNGVELMRRCRAAGFDGPALIVTAYPELDELVYAQQIDLIYSIVPKPVSIPHLKEKVELLIADSRFRKTFDGRRQVSRFDLRLDVEVDWGQGWQGTKTINVSLGGMLLADPPAGQTPTNVRVRIKHASGLFETAARVAHLSAQGAGIAFDDPPPRFRAALGDLITRFRFDVGPF